MLQSGVSNCDVRQVSLETVLRRAGGPIDLLKLDCEGAEWEILQPGTCWDSVRNVRLEYHLFHGETADQAQSALLALGFRILHFLEYSGSGGVIWAGRS